MLITLRNLSLKKKSYLYYMYRPVREAFFWLKNMVISPRNLSLKKTYLYNMYRPYNSTVNFGNVNILKSCIVP